MSEHADTPHDSALPHLTDDQVRDWTLQQKDEWWLKNVFKGDMPQLTVRSALTGMLLGGVLSMTNLYVGAKTGWTLGVGITSVILSFAIFKVFASLKLSSDMSLLENNAMQSIATAAGYMTGPLISSVGAYMLVTNKLIPLHVVFMWNVVLSILGVLFAFPLKKRFINDEQMPFPEGRAAGVVMHSLHTGDAKEGVFKAKLLVVTAGLAAVGTFFKSITVLDYIYRTTPTQAWERFQAARSPPPELVETWWMHVKSVVATFVAFLISLGHHPYKWISDSLPTAWTAVEGTTSNLLHLPEPVDGWFHSLFNPTLRGTPWKNITIRLESDFVMMAAGGLMGVRTGVSLMVGAVVNYFILVPWMIERGDIVGKLVDGQMKFGLKDITFWSLWCGVSMMTAASLFSFFSKPQVLIAAFKGLTSKKDPNAPKDLLADIELPLSVSAIGIPLMGALSVLIGWAYFGISPILGLIAIPLVFIFTLIAVTSTGLTSITPTGSLGKLTQLTFAGLAPGNVTTNLMTAGITSEVASNASNLLMDIKPGYMLGAKPRQQAIGHVLGIFAGALVSTPIYFLVFVKTGATGGVEIISDQYPFPGVVQWKAVAEVLTGGIDKLSVSARWAALFGAIVGLGLEITKLVTKGKFPISAVGVGLAFVLSFANSLSMALGSFAFGLAALLFKKGSGLHKVFVENQEPTAAGIIAGGALMGIVVTLLEVFVLG